MIFKKLLYNFYIFRVSDTYLPGNEGLHFKSRQCSESSNEAEPPELDQRDAIEQHTVREDECDVCPAHTGENRQHTIHHEHQRSVLWDERTWENEHLSLAI